MKGKHLAEKDRKEGITPKSAINWLLRVVKGAIIGVGAILPGISGGVLCVVLGIYKPMMAFLAHPVKTFKTNAAFLLPVLIGVAVGFVGLARVVEWMFNASFNLAVWLFIGLILGTTPSLFKEAGAQGRNTTSWIALCVSAVCVFGFLMLLQSGITLAITPNIGWFLLCGILWGLSIVAPGMSSSSILIFLGLYKPMAAGIADMNPQVLIPLVIGVAVMLYASARGINYLFEKHYSVAYHTVIGFVIASTLVILPLDFSGSSSLLASMACLFAGFIVALLFDYAGNRIKPKPDTEPVPIPILKTTEEGN